MEIIESASDQIMFIEKEDHYELIFMDDFASPSSDSSSDYSRFAAIFREMKDADHSKELHIFINSYGGSVDTLAMVLQQVTQFHTRIGVCCGIACSCGCNLLFSCQERYISPFCQVLFHDISISQGKEENIASALNFAQSSKRWSEEIDKTSCLKFFLTEEEIMQGKTSDVFLTGKELISRGACRDYSEYLSRGCLKKSKDVIQIGENLWKQIESGKWIKFTKGKKICSTRELLEEIKHKPAFPESGSVKI